MSSPARTRTEFLTLVLTSAFAEEQAKRFAFADGEVGAVYTLSRKAGVGSAQPVILFVATFPPSLFAEGAHGYSHNYGLDYCELPVASAEEAAQLLAQFDEGQAAQFRANCRAA